MPFEFNPANYKNTFTALVEESTVEPNPNKPTDQIWSAVLTRVRPNPTHTDWEPIDTGYPCGLPGCVRKPWHLHPRWYESERVMSAAHKFVMSIQDKGGINPTGPESILGKVFQWEEEIVPERRNPQTGGMWKEQRNYYIAGPAELNPQQDGQSSNGIAQATPKSELPWDAGQVSQPAPSQQVTTAASQSNVATIVPTATPGEKLNYEDALVELLPQIDGKTKDEVRGIIMQTSRLRSAEGLLLKWHGGKAQEELINGGFITEDENHVYHLA